MLCRMAGARVIAVDVNDYRLARAGELGAAHRLNPQRHDVAAMVRELADGGADVAVECSATASGALACVNSVRAGGRVAFPGLTGEVTLVSHRFGIDESPAAFATFFGPESAKVVFDFSVPAP